MTADGAATTYTKAIEIVLPVDIFDKYSLPEAATLLDGSSAGLIASVLASILRKPDPTEELAWKRRPERWDQEREDLKARLKACYRREAETLPEEQLDSIWPQFRLGGIFRIGDYPEELWEIPTAEWPDDVLEDWERRPVELVRLRSSGA